MEQILNIEQVNEFHFSNEEIEEFKSRSSQSSAIAISSS